MKRATLGSLVVVMLTVLVAPLGRSQQRPVTDGGLGCLVAQDWIVDSLREIGMQVGQEVDLRQETGSIPNVSPATPEVTNILLIVPSGRRGMLLFVKSQPDGTFVAIRNAYFLRRTSKGWSASEGNGGISTYNAMGAYASKLAKIPSVRVKLRPSADGCRVE